MKNQYHPKVEQGISTLEDLAQCVDYSLMDSLNADPQAKDNGVDHVPRQVFSGHYVPVNPMPIENPEYIAHSSTLFRELGFDESLAESDAFMRVFSGDLSQAPAPMRTHGWASGYALSIFGTEYYQQCPFNTGNGYGDGRAVSILEGVFPRHNGDKEEGKRWEMQLKGGGRTPYCRGADGRAVLRSSVREFLAQEHMHALGVPTSRSLTLYVSKTEEVERPWYVEGSQSFDPDKMGLEKVAITTRVAPSFLRVGQIELFGRRARKQEYPTALQELEQIVLHLIDREYPEIAGDGIDTALSLSEKVVLLAKSFRSRLTSLVANWVRVGYCQGNFNSDNTQAGGCTLDYGPFGFIEAFDPYYQPWTGGGQHFSFFNQPVAAERNFEMFNRALQTLVGEDDDAVRQLEEVGKAFANEMRIEMTKVFASKLGLSTLDGALFNELIQLMMQTSVDYTIFFRELSSMPENIDALKKSFYQELTQEQTVLWADWLEKWKALTGCESASKDEISEQMKKVNPKYILREWILAPAYQQAAAGNYDLVRELQQIMTQPYAEQSKEIEEKYYRLRPSEFNERGGVSHMSCSS